MTHKIGFRYNLCVETLSRDALVVAALGEGPASGVEVAARVKRLASSGAVLSPGTLYPLLRRLEGARLVRSWREVGRSRVGRPRRFHELTAEGAVALERQKGLLRALAAPARAPGAAPDVRSMRENLRRAFAVSAFAARLAAGRAER